MDVQKALDEMDGEALSPMEQPRKPYAKPAIVYQAPLEVMAGVCSGVGKAPTFCGLTFS